MLVYVRFAPKSGQSADHLMLGFVRFGIKPHDARATSGGVSGRFTPVRPPAPSLRLNRLCLPHVIGSAPHCPGTGEQPAYLCFRRGARRHASPAHFYCAFGTHFLRRCYYQILGPHRHPPKFTNGLCRYSEVFVCLNSHLIWQTAKSDVERGSAFGLVSHTFLPTDCS